MRALRVTAAWLLLCSTALAVPTAPTPPIPYGAAGGVPQLDSASRVQPTNLAGGTAAAKGFSMQLLGDSRGQNGNLYAPTDAAFPGIIKGLQNPLSWAEAFSGGKLTWDPSTGPYVASAASGAIIGWKIINGGSGYTAPTLSVPVAVGHVATLGVTNGVITSVSISAFGAKPSSEVIKGTNYTIPDSTGSGAILTPVLNGSGTYSVAGTQLDELNARLDDIINETYAPKPHFLAVVGGTNGLPGVVAGTTTLRAQLAIAMTIIQRASAAGMHVIWLAENPKSSIAYGSGTAGTNASLVNDAFIRAMQKMADLDSNLNPLGVPFDLVDMNRYEADGTLLSGSQQGGSRNFVTGDGLHWTPWGAEIEGYGLELALRPYYQVQASSDYGGLGYSAAWNPLGNLIPLFSGTTGTVTSPNTGVAPTGWLLFAPTNGSGTGTVASSISAPSAAVPDAQGLILPTWTWTFALTNNGSASGNISGVLTTTIPNLAVGDKLRFSCEVVTTGFTNLMGISVLIQDGSGAGAVVTKYGTEAAAYMAPAYDSLVGALPPKGAVNPTRLSVTYTVTPTTIATGSIKPQLGVWFDASAAPATSAIGMSAGVTGSVSWRNCQVVKLNTSLIQ